MPSFTTFRLNAVFVFLISDLAQAAKGLCKDLPSVPSSELCHEYLHMSKNGVVTNCGNSTLQLSCQGRCKTAYERTRRAKCFCDSYCSVLGDCCVDYSNWCNKSQVYRHDVMCLPARDNRMKGHVVIAGCPVEWRNKALEQECLTQSPKEPLSRIPVYDYDKGMALRNVFCAVCNKAINYTYWKVRFFLSRRIEPKKAIKISIADVIQNREWTVEPPQSSLVPFCVPSPTTEVAQTTFAGKANKLISFCTSYSMPVFKGCANHQEVKNPHCGQLLYHNNNNLFPTKYSCRRKYICGGKVSTYSLLFDFKTKGTPSAPHSSNSHTIEYNCETGDIFDPFKDRCLQVNSLAPAVNTSSTNGTFLNRTKTDNFNYHQPHKISSLLSLVGSAVSIAALSCFLLTRFLFSKLRTLHGKNLISLSCALLAFQVTLVQSDQRSRQTVCDLITGVLHFTLLSVFSWMSVVAYDVSRTFTAKGSSSSSRQHEKRETKRFILYSLYGWGMPLTIVATCISVDVTTSIDIGYGEEKPICYLSPTGRIYGTAVPIAAVLVFNFVALTRTLIAIRHVQQGTRVVVTNSPQPTSIVLCLKLTSVMGFTWILGFVFAIVNSSYVEYVYTIINSLQGLFIFLSFGCNKQIIALYKAMCCKACSRTEVVGPSKGKLRNGSSNQESAY